LASIFSASPSFNDTFTSNGTTWQWNGEAWIVVASDGQTFTNVVTSPSSQTITADSPTDTLTIAAGTNISVSGNSSNDTLTISSTINTQDLINTASAAAYTSASGYTNFIVDGLDTLDIEENTNLYFTNQRAIDATSSLITSASANALSQANTYSNSASAAAYASASANTLSQINALTTSDIEEGTNLYFTNERAVNSGSATYLTQAAYASASSNFATDTELASAIVTASAAAVAYADGLTTADVAENTNLYFTNERAVNAGSATYILQSSQQGIINSASAAAVTAVLDGAPGALDTLNELAAALNDDASFATTITNSIFEKLSASTASTTYATITSLASASAAAVSYADGLTTADVAENTNLYFTNERAVNAGSATYLTQAAYASASANFATDAELASAIVTASAAAVAYADGLTTTDVAEGTNLYYTNARGQQTASTMFVHGNHTNLSAQYVSGEIRLTSSAAGGGGATVAYQTTQPDTSTLDAGSLWIDSDQEAISGLLPATFTRWIEVLSASATTLSGLDDNALSLIYTPGYEKVFINGTLLVRGSDYTATTGNTIVLTTAAESGDAVEVHSYESFQIADTYTQAAADAKFFAIDESRIDRWTKTYSASATTITGVDDYSESLLYTSGLESLYINGVLVDPSEYTRTSASVITPDEAIISGDVVDIITPKAFEVANTYTIAQIDAKYNTRTRWTKTFSASATVISGVDDNSLSLLYTAGYEEVYLNGILLTPITDYARTSASVITLGSAVVTSDIIEIVNTQPFNVADTYTTTQADNRYLTQSSASSTYYTQTQIDTLEKGPAFFAHRTSTQSVTAGTTTKVQLNGELFDTHGCFDSTTNYRFTPTVAGYYQFNATLGIFGNNGSQSNVVLRKNGSDYCNTLAVVGAGTAARITTSTLAYMNGSTDYMEMFGVGQSGTVEFIGGADSTQFSGVLVRRA
jgi:hypothetical protein